MHEPSSLSHHRAIDTASRESVVTQERRPVRVQRDVFATLQDTQRGQRGVQFDIGFIASAALRLFYAQHGANAKDLILRRAHEDYLVQEGLTSRLVRDSGPDTAYPAAGVLR